MEFHEKLQQLRKQKGLTQEELAQILFVSRTAISKWESGRGYPNLDSLKAIAGYFSVSIDQLLSGEQVLTIAEEETRQTESRLRDLVFGALDCSAVMLLFVPFFGQTVDGVLQAVSLLTMTEAAPYLRVLYLAVAGALTGLGIVTFALQNCRQTLWLQCKSKLSLSLSAVGVLLFILGRQPYGAAFLFLFLVIKGILLIK